MSTICNANGMRRRNQQPTGHVLSRAGSGPRSGGVICRAWVQLSCMVGLAQNYPAWYMHAETAHERTLTHTHMMHLMHMLMQAHAHTQIIMTVVRVHVPVQPILLEAEPQQS